MSTAGTTRVVCCQLAPVVGDIDGNKRAVLAGVTDAAARGADIIVLPELATSGYPFTSVEQAIGAAMTRDDPAFTEWAAAAGTAIVVLGFAEIGDGGVLHNSAAVLEGGRLRAVYRKTHLWDDEANFFTPGDEPPPVLDTACGRIGVLVCYDMEFPEMTRSLAMRGADLLVVPTNWPLLETPPPGEHAPEVVIAMAAARVNHLFIVCCDRTDSGDGKRWTHGTAIVSAHGWVVAAAPSAAVGTVSADLDLLEARRKNISARNHVFDDRRPHLYGDPETQSRKGVS